MKKEKHVCDACGGDFDTLYTRQGFRQSFYCEFVCESCFLRLEGCTFEEYNDECNHKEIDNA